MPLGADGAASWEIHMRVDGVGDGDLWRRAQSAMEQDWSRWDMAIGFNLLDRLKTTLSLLLVDWVVTRRSEIYCR